MRLYWMENTDVDFISISQLNRKSNTNPSTPTISIIEDYFKALGNLRFHADFVLDRET